MSLLELINQPELWEFHGGIHPPENKQQTSSSNILPIEFPEQLILPLKQHIGTAGRILVNVGDEVKKGQALTASDSHHSCPIHAPTSGKIIAIEPHTICHPSGLSEACIFLKPDLKDSWKEKELILDYQQESAENLIEHLRQMGIAGLGGAGFPSARKIQSGLGRAELLIINAAECEPYITADDRLMQEHADEIIQGVQILQHILTPALIIIAIEDNKRDAIVALQKAAVGQPNIQVKIIPTKYPSGGEKQLIQILTGKEIPTDKIPADIGILVQNVATVFAIKRAVIDGEPLIQRVVTLVGQTLDIQANRWVLLGTKVSFLLEKHGHKKDKQLNRLIVGGPMMGFSAPDIEVPVTKTTNCLLIPSAKELPVSKGEISCIRCSACAEVCPASLLPQQLHWYAKQKDHEKCEKYHIFDCIECGICAYVCPSEIPLVQYYRQTKANIRYERAEQQASEIAKLRFEAKKARIEREKLQRESRHKQAALERQQVISKTDEQDAVAAAIARVKAKQQSTAQDKLDNAAVDEKQQIREARKQQAREHKEAQTKESIAESIAQPDTKKAAVSAAIERAKAKKAAQEKALLDTSVKQAAEGSEQDPKKVAIAAAIERAKARKAAQEKESQPAAESIEDPKKAAVAAAVERAKARKAAQEKILAPSIPAKTDAEQKKAAVAAAVERAKARKAIQERAGTSTQNISTEDEAARKKAAIAAAVERAKARKAAEQKTSETKTDENLKPAAKKTNHKDQDK